MADCGPHGSCIGGACHCEEGWTGPECEQRDCHPRCIDHGVCREGKCDCHQGWTGEHCTIGEPWRHPHPPHTGAHTTEHITYLKRANCSERFQACDDDTLLQLPPRSQQLGGGGTLHTEINLCFLQSSFQRADPAAACRQLNR